MMRTLHAKFDKAALADMQRVVFEGRMIVVQTETDAEKAIAYLSDYPIVGVDTETRPAFRKGVTNKVALLQISTEDTCFLFRLNHIGLPDSIRTFFENPSVLKIGLSLRDDLASLCQRNTFNPVAFLDLQQYVKQFGVQDLSLQKLYANVFGKKISKGQRLSNWEADILSEGQKLYAATDAWACVQLYNELEQLKSTGQYCLVANDEVKCE